MLFTAKRLNDIFEKLPIVYKRCPANYTLYKPEHCYSKSTKVSDKVRANSVRRIIQFPFRKRGAPWQIQTRARSRCIHIAFCTCTLKPVLHIQTPAALAPAPASSVIHIVFNNKLPPACSRSVFFLQPASCVIRRLGSKLAILFSLCQVRLDLSLFSSLFLFACLSRIFSNRKDLEPSISSLFFYFFIRKIVSCRNF